ncbi:CAP domain-containing protein [Kineococcus sp. SYSU DK002]|uniref:CAP domain-containing protein n=1 Tax=Kineococcus sp. SYSU DK002 TaxID=3383123 RepID=UPI003D7E3B34
MDTTARTPRTARRHRLLGAAAAVAGAAVAAVAGAGAAQADGPALTGDGGQAWRSYELVNAARAQAGLPALGLTDEANRVATDWAFRMAGDAQLKHNPDLSRQLQGWSLVAENVGVGADADQLQGAFMASPGHRANILRPEVSVVGLGAVRSQDGRVWVVQVFEQPNGPVAGFHPAPAPAPVAQPAALPVAAQPLPAPGFAAAPTIERDLRDLS